MDQPTDTEQTVCTICHETLKRNIAALRCRHVFHHSCISMWLGSTNRSRCPNCNQATTLQGIIGPLFLEYEPERPETVVIDPPPPPPPQEPNQHEVRIRELEHLNESLKTRLRQLKLIKVVRETRADLSSPSSQARLSNWQTFERKDLLTVVGALHAKCAAIEREKDAISERLKSAEGKINALERAIRNMKAEERQKMSNWSRAGSSVQMKPYLSSRVTEKNAVSYSEDDTTDGEDEAGNFACSSNRRKRKRLEGSSSARREPENREANEEIGFETNNDDIERQENRYHIDSMIPETISSDDEVPQPAVRIQARQNRPQDPLRLRQIQPTVINLEDSPIVIDD